MQVREQSGRPKAGCHTSPVRRWSAAEPEGWALVPFFDISGLTVYYLEGASGWSPIDEWYVGAPLNEFTLAWNAYTTFHLTYVDTGDWLGILDILHSPWVFHFDSDRYVYVPESSADGNGTWVYWARP